MHFAWGSRSLATVLLALGLTSFSRTQDLPSVLVSQPAPGCPAIQQINSEAPPIDKGDHRILFVMPGYGVSIHHDAAPLTPKEKFMRSVKGTFDPYSWISTGAMVGLSQVDHQFPEYGRGVSGYSKRYGAAMADQTTGSFSGAAYCILFKEDPRYFRLGEGPITHRLLYSLAQEFSAKSDKGTRMPKWSHFLSAFTSSTISNAYYPDANRGFGKTMKRAGTSFLWDFTGELPDEFWPDIKRKFFQRNTSGIIP